MSKKKVISLLVAGVLTTGIVGGTLAWFTSSDNVTNKFTTGSYNDTDTKGLDIWEKFTPDEAKNLTPGADVTKKVQVQNTASYGQFIRVKLTPNWTAPDAVKDTDTNLELELNNDAIKTEPTEGYWYKGTDGYYYFMGVVGAGKYTPLLLNSVKVLGTAGNDYVGGAFDVKVDSDSIQSDHEAYKDWAGAPDDVKAALATLNTDKGEAANTGDTSATGTQTVFE